MEYSPCETARRLLGDGDTVRALAAYLERKQLPQISYYDEGGQSLLLISPDRDIVLRLSHGASEGESQGLYTEKKLLPLESYPLGDYMLRVYAYLPTKGGNRHVNILREAVAADGIEFWDAKPDNVRLLPDEAGTPVVTDEGALRPGEGHGFLRFQAIASAKPQDYAWEGLQQELFAPLCQKYGLAGVAPRPTLRPKDTGAEETFPPYEDKGGGHKGGKGSFPNRKNKFFRHSEWEEDDDPGKGNRRGRQH